MGLGSLCMRVDWSGVRIHAWGVTQKGVGKQKKTKKEGFVLHLTLYEGETSDVEV